MMETMDDILRRLVAMRSEVFGIEDPAERGEAARKVIVGMLGFVAQFMGDELMQAAYEEIDPDDRKETLRIAARRLLTASALFAKLT